MNNRSLQVSWGHCLSGVLVLCAFGVSSSVEATPRMSLVAGTPCIACHVNPTGGGGRTELGWGSMNRVGALNYDQIGLDSLHNQERNTLFDGLFSLGIDARVQAARLGNPTIDDSVDPPATLVPDMVVFPMQLQPYLLVKPGGNLSLYGTYSFGPETLRGGKICDEVIPGMSCFEAFALLEPSGSLPTVRAGVFQPAIGVRHDDHTIFIRGDARDRRRPVIAPNYADPGLEVILQPVSWFRSELGAYVPLKLDNALNGASTTAELWPVAYNVRASFLPYIAIPYAVEADDGFDDFDDEPETEDYIINSWFGASAFGSGDFLMLNGFVGLGVHEGVSLVAEVSHTRRTLEYRSLNGLIGLNLTPWSWINASVRVERASTKTADDRSKALSLVGSLEFFPLPYLEIRPEYRLVETEEYRFGQATAQLHIFY